MIRECRICKTNQDIKIGRRCRQCFNKILQQKRGYKKCNGCGIELTEFPINSKKVSCSKCVRYVVRKVCDCCGKKHINSTNFCKHCDKIDKSIGGFNTLIRLGIYIESVKSKHFFIDWFDISEIIEYFNVIFKDRITKYDRYEPSKQILLMWKDILVFYKENQYLLKNTYLKHNI